MGIHKFKGIKYKKTSGDTVIQADISMDRIEGNMNRAQFALDSAVMTSMVPFMPMITGTFINLTRARSAAMAGTGYVCAAAPPYGRFLYKGKTMVDEVTGSPYARYGARKVLVSRYGGETKAKPNLKYTTKFHPRARSEWFEAAKDKDEQKWIRTAKNMAGEA